MGLYSSTHVPSSMTEAELLRLLEPLHRCLLIMILELPNCDSRFFTGPSDFLVTFMTYNRYAFQLPFIIVRMSSMRARLPPPPSQQTKLLNWFVFSSFAITTAVFTPSFFAYTSIEIDCNPLNVTQTSCFDWLHPRLEVGRRNVAQIIYIYLWAGAHRGVDQLHSHQHDNSQWVATFLHLLHEHCDNKKTPGCHGKKNTEKEHGKKGKKC